MREGGYTEKQILTQAEVVIACMTHYAWMDAQRHKLEEDRKRHNEHMARFARGAQYAFFGLGAAGTITGLVIGIVHGALPWILLTMVIYWICIVGIEFSLANDVERWGGKRWPWQ